MDFESLSFRSVSVKKLFRDMKDTAELMIDLSYSAVFSDNKKLAEEVLGLEEKMDKLQYQSRMSMMLSARKQADAEKLAPLMAIIGATEDISNAAGDIAKIVKKDIQVPQQVKRLISQTYEPVATVEVENSEISGKDFSHVFHPSIHVLALKRDGEWEVGPEDQTVKEGDKIIIKGPEEHVRDFRSEEKFYEDREEIDHVDRAVDTVKRMKDFSELAVDLSYSSVFSNSKPVAEEVQDLEEKIDSLLSNLIEWVLRAAGKMEEPLELKGLLQIAYSTEIIADSALEISESVLRGMEVHPVFEKAMKESEEIVISRKVESLTDVEKFSKESVEAMAVKKFTQEGTEWILLPEKDINLETGDIIILKGSPEHLTHRD